MLALTTTVCFLYLKIDDHIRSVWGCKDIGYVISYNPKIWELEPKRDGYPFIVGIDSKGDKVLILRKEK